MAKLVASPKMLERASDLLVPSDRPWPDAEETTKELIRSVFTAGEPLLRDGTARSMEWSGPELPLLGLPVFVQSGWSAGLPALYVATSSGPKVFGVTLARDGADFEVIGTIFADFVGDAGTPTWWSYCEQSGRQEFAWGFASGGVIQAVRSVDSGRWHGRYWRRPGSGDPIPFPKSQPFVPAGELRADGTSSTAAGAGSVPVDEQRDCSTAQQVFDALLPLVSPRPVHADSRLREK